MARYFAQWKTCYHKTQYSCLASAEYEVEFGDSKGMQPYDCPFCEYYHVGHKMAYLKRVPPLDPILRMGPWAERDLARIRGRKMHWIVILYLLQNGDMVKVGTRCFESKPLAQTFQQRWTQEGFEKGEERATDVENIDNHPAYATECGCNDEGVK